MFILQFFFFLFIIVLIVGLFIAIRIYLTIRRTANKFKNFATGGFKQSDQQSNFGGKSAKPKNLNIIDTRSEEVRNRKIFPDRVGDFVKFKEVK